jgi:hypothetical protein
MIGRITVHTCTENSWICFWKTLVQITWYLVYPPECFSFYQSLHNLKNAVLTFCMDENAVLHLYLIIIVTPIYIQNRKRNLLGLGMCLVQVAASMQKDVEAHVPSYPNLPSKLICLLHSVTLQVI